jgi:bacterioferritin-associated ferredoxin
MYICVCKAVTDKQIKSAIESGVCTRKQLYQCTGAGDVCGKCNQHIKTMLNANPTLHAIMPALQAA